jgi:tungstate transport system substrate-binding protein
MQTISSGKCLFRLLTLLAALVALWACNTSPQILIVATTTSTADSGLLDDILPPFEDEAKATVRVLAVGTGQAIALGERGDADIILIHDRDREERFVAEGWGTLRKDVMYNDFVVVGPVHDPTGVSNTASATQAFARIAQAGVNGKSVFVSRADQSGTHSKELLVWERAGIDPTGVWYKTTGQGMGDTLTVANEFQAYTFSDRATYLARQDRLDLKILVEGDSSLLNPYAVIPVNPERHARVNHELALAFVEYLTRYETQERIATFGLDTYGQPLFYPNSVEWKSGR